jgi:uncharacterized membrane protein YsdA (DUF1294 family)
VPAYCFLSPGLTALNAPFADGSDDRPLNWFLLWLLLINLVAFGTYLLDKMAAGSGLARVSERRLLLLALAGGSPSAILAMYLFRHKIRKSSFMARFWLTVALQVSAGCIIFDII